MIYSLCFIQQFSVQNSDRFLGSNPNITITFTQGTCLATIVSIQNDLLEQHVTGFWKMGFQITHVIQCISKGI